MAVRTRWTGGRALPDWARAARREREDWARTARRREAVVNTTRSNARATALSESHGFVDLPAGLVLLERAQ